MTPTSGSPLSSGARADSGSLRCRAQGGSPQLQSTGRARQKRAKGLGRGRLEKNPQKAQPAPPLPALTLEFRSSNPQPPLTPRPLPSHSPHSNIHTQGLCRCHWLPFPHPRGMNGQTRIKPHSSFHRKSNHWVWAQRVHVLSDPLAVCVHPHAESGCTPRVCMCFHIGSGDCGKSVVLEITVKMWLKMMGHNGSGEGC